jgi:hypothetical protein
LKNRKKKRKKAKKSKKKNVPPFAPFSAEKKCVAGATGFRAFSGAVPLSDGEWQWQGGSCIIRKGRSVRSFWYRLERDSGSIGGGGWQWKVAGGSDRFTMTVT